MTQFPRAIVLLMALACVFGCAAPNTTSGLATPASHQVDAVPTGEIEWPLREMYVRLRWDAERGRTVYQYLTRTMEDRAELREFLTASLETAGRFTLAQYLVRFDVADDVPWRDVSDAVVAFKAAGYTDVCLLVPLPFDEEFLQRWLTPGEGRDNQVHLR